MCVPFSSIVRCGPLLLLMCGGDDGGVGGGGCFSCQRERRRRSRQSTMTNCTRLCCASQSRLDEPYSYPTRCLLSHRLPVERTPHRPFGYLPLLLFTSFSWNGHPGTPHSRHWCWMTVHHDDWRSDNERFTYINIPPPSLFGDLSYWVRPTE